MTITHLQSPIMVHRPRLFSRPVSSPADVAGLYAWYKADAGTYQDNLFATPASADGDVVGGWQDQSGGGWHAVQGTTTKKPCLKIGANGLNGLPVVRSDGSDDVLDTSSITHAIGTGDFWWMVVLRRYTVPALAWDAILANGLGAPGWYLQSNTTNVHTSYFGAAKAFNTTLTSGGVYILELGRENGVIKAVVNGVQEANTYSLPAFVVGSATLHLFQSGFAGESGPLDMAEALFYKPAPPDSHKAALRVYLNGRWAVY